MVLRTPPPFSARVFVAPDHDLVAWTAPGPAEPGDFVVMQSAPPHPLSTLTVDVLCLLMRPGLIDALTGAVLTVPGLDYQQLHLLLDPVIAPDHDQRLRGRGMPSRTDPTVRGAVLATLDITTPKRVDAARRPALREFSACILATIARKRYIPCPSGVFVNLQPHHADALRSCTAVGTEMAATAHRATTTCSRAAHE